MLVNLFLCAQLHLTKLDDSNISDLPFDLRERRVVEFTCAIDIINRINRITYYFILLYQDYIIYIK